MLLLFSQRGFSLADELATGPGKYQREQTYEEQLSSEIHRVTLLDHNRETGDAITCELVDEPAVTHAIDSFNCVEIRIDVDELAPDSLDVRGDRIVIENRLRGIH